MFDWDNPKKEITREDLIRLVPGLRPELEKDILDSDGHILHPFLVEKSPENVFIHVDGVIKFSNQVGANLLGFSEPDNVIDKSFFDFLHPDFVELAKERIRVIINEDQSFQPIITKLKCRDGSQPYVEIWGGPITYFGEPASQIIVRDVVWKKDMREAPEINPDAILNAKEEWEITADSIPDLICTVDTNGTVYRANRTLEKWKLGRVHRVKGKKIQRVLHPRDSMSTHIFNKYWRKAKKRMGEGRRVSFEYYNDHLESHLLVRLRPLHRLMKWMPINSAVIIIEDISDSKKAQEALEEQSERLSVTLRSIADGVITTDATGKIVLINRVAEKMTGYSEKEAVGKPLDEALKLLDEEHRTPFVIPIKKVMSTGKSITHDRHFILVSKRNQEYVIKITVAPMRNNQNQIIGILFVFQDVTETRRLELSKAGFLNAISHELRTPLTSILGNTQLLQSLELGNDLEEFVDGIENSVSREIKLVDELFTIVQLESGTETYQLAQVDPYSLLLKIDQKIQILIEKLINERYKYDEYEYNSDISPKLGDIYIRVDPDRIHMVIENLVTNAIKYSPPDRVSISLSAYPEGENLVVSVADKGVGIPKPEFKNIFKPFYQVRKTKFAVSDGIGYGLAKVRRFIRVHGGKISVESTIDEGSVFTFTLPIVPAQGMLTKTN
ncbi:MAG: hypothetical protein B6244_07900 [Candidatus Cloacimonetes bacterium 4572_55]|nr:MAG: hypothetical protein B6244_07900 [Candidatus Cloacimonetes bacterium 4572_55]